MREHRGLHTLAHRDPPLAADQINAISAIIGLFLSQISNVGMQSVLKAKRRHATLAQHQTGIAVLRVHLLRVFDIDNGRFAPIALHQVRVRPLDVATEKPYPVVEMRAHLHQRIARPTPALVKSPHLHKLTNIAGLDHIQRELIIGAGALDMVYRELHPGRRTGGDHFIGLDQVERGGFFTEDVYAALGRGNRRPVVLRRLGRDQGNIRCYLVEQALILLVNRRHPETLAPSFSAFGVYFSTADEFTIFLRPYGFGVVSTHAAEPNNSDAIVFHSGWSPCRFACERGVKSYQVSCP